MLDKDGQYNLSKVLFISGRMDKKIHVTNPFSDQINIRLSWIPSSSIQVTLSDLTGKLIAKQDLSNTTDGMIQFNKIPALLSNGIYVLQIKVAEQEFRFKLLKK